MKTLFLFIGWIFMKATEGIRNTNDGYREFMRDQPWGGIIVGLLLTVVSFIVLSLVTVLIATSYGVRPENWVFMLYLIPQVSYIIYTGVSLMYNAFKAERAELFETIKNGK